MSNDVVLSSALRNNLLSLQGTQRSIDTTQLRLATGLRVNSALDNPQNFFTAQSLNNRAGDLQRLLDGIGQSIRTIEQANTGVETLDSLLDQAEAIALDAQSEVRSAEGFSRIRGSADLASISDFGTETVITDGDSFDVIFSDSATGNTQTTTIAIGPNAGEAQNVNEIAAIINADPNLDDLVQARVTSSGQLEIASQVDGASLRVEDNTGFDLADFTALGLDTIVATETTGAGAVTFGGTSIAGNQLTSAVSSADTVNGQFEASALLSDATNGPALLDAAGSVDVNLVIDGDVVNTGTINGTDSIQTLIDNINNAGNSEVVASFNTDTGQIELDFDDTVGQVSIQFDGAPGGGTLGFAFGGSTNTDGATGANVVSENFTFDGVSAEVDQFEEDFNEIRTQIDDLIGDANFRGVNLLGGDNLETFFNEDGNSTLETEGVDFSVIGLGLDIADFTNANNVQVSIDSVRGAIDEVRTFGRSIANDLSIIETRRDFTENTINTLRAGADDLTIADQNEEGANLLALQTRQQLGVTSLALAAESQQSVLRLF